MICLLSGDSRQISPSIRLRHVLTQTRKSRSRSSQFLPTDHPTLSQTPRYPSLPSSLPHPISCALQSSSYSSTDIESKLTQGTTFKYYTDWSKEYMSDSFQVDAVTCLPFSGTIRHAQAGLMFESTPPGVLLHPLISPWVPSLALRTPLLSFDSLHQAQTSVTRHTAP